MAQSLDRHLPDWNRRLAGILAGRPTCDLFCATELAYGLISKGAGFKVHPNPASLSTRNLGYKIRLPVNE